MPAARQADDIDCELRGLGFTVEARRVLLHLMAGSKEDSATVTAFLEDMKGRGLNDPLLGWGAGIIKAIVLGRVAGVQGPRA